MEQEKMRVQLDVKARLRWQFKAKAAAEGMTMTEALERLLQLYVSGELGELRERDALLT